MSELITAARPYARAAFEFAREHDAVDRWSQSLVLLAAAASDDAVKRLIQDPRCPPSRIAGLMVAVAGDAADEYIRNFVQLLAANRRLALAAPIADLFTAYRAAAEERMHAEIVSAFELDPAQREAIRAALARRMGKEVEVACWVEPALLAGAVVRAGDFVMDGSLRGKLDKLAAELSR
ncbi:MAG: F0F1 ATP synthase subunit delta [Gammaproteobacteria bacterium]|nr:F0F1 ATP synthase subunit delta [Gammaproteobacteria bacterium]